MSQYWWQQYPSWWGPVVDPAPDPWMTGAELSWRTPIPADPAPWPWPRPMPMPMPRPIPRPWPWPPWVDPAPDGGFLPRPGGGWRGPIPADPAPWGGGEPSPWRVRPRWPVVADPSPEDLRVKVDVFAQWARDVLVAAGHRADAIDKASVRDLVSAFAAVNTPAIARSTATAVTATQVGELDRDGLERLQHHLASERTRLDELTKLVATRLGKETGK